MAYNRFNNYHRPNFFGGFQFFPPVIKTLLIANASVFLGMMFFGSFRLGDFYFEEFFYHAFALWPLGAGFGFWQLFTYMFMHANFTHILFNMLALWMFGMELENMMGSKKFMIFYLLCGFGGGLANLLIAPMFSAVGPTVGASGAVYGVLLAFGMLFPDRPIYVYFLLPIKAKYFVLIYMAIELFSVTSSGGDNGIAHFAHLGGAVVGFFYLIADGYRFHGLYGRSAEPSVFSKFTNPFAQAPKRNSDYAETADATVYDIREFQKKEDLNNSQKQVDEILDKISRGGYQSLTDDEKKILFEASKNLN